VSETCKHTFFTSLEEARLGDFARLTIQSPVASEVCHLLYGPSLNREHGPTHNPGVVQGRMRDGSSEVITWNPVETQNDDSDLEGPDGTLRRILGYLTGTKSFGWLTRRIQTFMSRSRGTSLHQISGQLLCVLRDTALSDTKSPGMSFSIDCGLKAYVKAASDGHVTLTSLICVNASGGLHEASTFGEYMARMWPATGARFLEILQEWIDVIDGWFRRKSMIRFTSTYN
jgi:hypothetical protein